MGEVDLEGLRRMDAVVLAALLMRETGKPPAAWPRRLFAIARFRLRARLHRLERRGLVAPGWHVGVFKRPHLRVDVTPEGRRVARAAMVTLELEFGVRDFEL